jgi:HD-GYP domain-containing protein (c-di-GMP phosphodiesterase class II)
MDGSGYPSNLTGAQISLAARILHVADVYCSKMARVHYRPPKSLRLAFKELFGTERTQIDMQIASLLLRRIGLLPPGTLVRLSNRETACITRLGRNGQVRLPSAFSMRAATRSNHRVNAI